MLGGAAVAGWITLVGLIAGSAYTELGRRGPGEPAVAPPPAPAPASVRPAPAAEVMTASVPVLLVPGWLDTARDLAALRIRFLAAGWEHVETLTFRDPAGSNREHALEIDSMVVQMLAETGAERIDIVAHSMGGLATRWYLLTHESAPVRRVVFLGSPHRGTLAAHLAWGAGGDEMTPGSDFLETLNAAPPVPDPARAMTVRTPIDTRVVPGESATLPGVEDHSVCCPTHLGLVRDEEVFALVVDFLERSAPRSGAHE